MEQNYLCTDELNHTVKERILKSCSDENSGYIIRVPTHGAGALGLYSNRLFIFKIICLKFYLEFKSF